MNVIVLSCVLASASAFGMRMTRMAPMRTNTALDAA